MDTIVNGYFSRRTGHPEFLNKQIHILKNALIDTQVTITLKMHVLIVHIEQCLQFLEEGLGTWSEQEGESVHREFIRYRSKYKINMIENPRFSENLRRAVVEFASKNI